MRWLSGKPDGEIEVRQRVQRNFPMEDTVTKIPFIRGVFNFMDSHGTWNEDTDLFGKLF